MENTVKGREFQITYRTPAGVQETEPIDATGQKFLAQLLAERGQWYDVGRVADSVAGGRVVLRQTHSAAIEAYFATNDLPVKVRKVKGQNYVAITPLPVYNAKKAIREANKAK